MTTTTPPPTRTPAAVTPVQGELCSCHGGCGGPAWHLESDGRCGNRHGLPRPIGGATHLIPVEVTSPATPTVRRRVLLCQDCATRVTTARAQMERQARQAGPQTPVDDAPLF